MDYHKKYIGDPTDHDQSLHAPTERAYALPKNEEAKLKAAVNKLIIEHKVLLPEETITLAQQLAYAYFNSHEGDNTANGTIALLQSACEYANAPRLKVYEYVQQRKKLKAYKHKIDQGSSNSNKDNNNNNNSSSSSTSNRCWLPSLSLFFITRYLLEKNLEKCEIKHELLWNEISSDFEKIPMKIIKAADSHLEKYNYLNIYLQGKTLDSEEKEELNLIIAAGLLNIGIKETFKSKISIRNHILISGLIKIQQPSLWALEAYNDNLKVIKKFKKGINKRLEGASHVANILSKNLSPNTKYFGLSALKPIPAPSFLLIGIKQKNIDKVVQEIANVVFDTPDNYFMLDLANYNKPDSIYELFGRDGSEGYGSSSSSSSSVGEDDEAELSQQELQQYWLGKIPNYMSERPKGLIYIKNWVDCDPRIAEKFQGIIKTGFYECPSYGGSTGRSRKGKVKSIFSSIMKKKENQVIDFRGCCFIFGHKLDTTSCLNSIARKDSKDDDAADNKEGGGKGKVSKINIKTRDILKNLDQEAIDKINDMIKNVPSFETIEESAKKPTPSSFNNNKKSKAASTNNDSSIKSPATSNTTSTISPATAQNNAKSASANGADGPDRKSATKDLSEKELKALKKQLKNEKDLRKQHHDNVRRTLGPVVHACLDQFYSAVANDTAWGEALSYVNKDLLIDVPELINKTTGSYVNLPENIDIPGKNADTAVGKQEDTDDDEEESDAKKKAKSDKTLIKRTSSSSGSSSSGSEDSKSGSSKKKQSKVKLSTLVNVIHGLTFSYLKATNTNGGSDSIKKDTATKTAGKARKKTK
ncbi:hypothetical protein H4219_005885 [Mycoemilia scoparia]|uniref:Uncharacterized protein n=1 Tax=Mycoemilia scoparia TaxID=417184 RepID=A0A9W8DK59_9FUNG|nr:hypothetical protein H4219_005885 [Mycoemilia scoparia]